MNVMCVKNGLAPPPTSKPTQGCTRATNRSFVRYARPRSHS